MRVGRFGILVCAMMMAMSAMASAAPPKVALSLSGAVITMVRDKTVASPLAGKPVKRGETIRYTILAKNIGSQPALALVPKGKVPTNTEFLRVLNVPKGTRVEYTLDGTAWSPKPMITVMGKDGKPHRAAAPPALFHGVRWIVEGPLPAHQMLSFPYEVRVK